MVITVKGAQVQLLKFLCCHSIERGTIGIRESTSRPPVSRTSDTTFKLSFYMLGPVVCGRIFDTPCSPLGG